VLLSFGGIALLLTGKNENALPGAVTTANAIEPPKAAALAVKDSETKAAEIQIEYHLQQLRQAMTDKNDKAKSNSLRELSRLVTQNAAVLENLMDRIKTEPDAEVLFAIGQMALDTGVPGNQKAITDTALNLLLSDDTAARRKASLDIVANSPALTPELAQAIARVSREDLSIEIKDEATATIEKWMADWPELRPVIEEALAVPLNTDQSTLSTQQK
jgi:hypothetical protein